MFISILFYIFANPSLDQKCLVITHPRLLETDHKNRDSIDIFWITPFSCCTKQFFFLQICYSFCKLCFFYLKGGNKKGKIGKLPGKEMGKDSLFTFGLHK